MSITEEYATETAAVFAEDQVNHSLAHFGVRTKELLGISIRHKMKDTPIAFDAWKGKLRRECYLQGRQWAFWAMGDSVLRLLWESGLDPSVHAIVEGLQREHREHDVAQK